MNKVIFFSIILFSFINSYAVTSPQLPRSDSSETEKKSNALVGAIVRAQTPPVDVPTRTRGQSIGNGWYNSPCGSGKSSGTPTPSGSPSKEKPYAPYHEDYP